jgi:hypothetical protein
LLLIEDADRPFLTRAIRVPDRVTAHLPGDDEPDPALAGVLVEPRTQPGRQSSALANAFRKGQRLCYLREAAGSFGAAVAADALTEAGRTVLCCDATRLAAGDDLSTTVAVLGREALLRGAGLIVSPVDALFPHAANVITQLARLPVPLVLTGSTAWDPQWSDAVPLVTEASRLSVEERTRLWKHELGPLQDEFDVADIAAQFVFGPRQVAAAIRSATALATLTGRLGANSQFHLRITAASAGAHGN